MPGLIQVLVYWCTLTAPIDSFNPHQVHAVQSFIRDNPATCHVDKADVLDEPNLTLGECNRRAMVEYLPGWLNKNLDKLYLGADCVPYQLPAPEHLDLQALKDRVTP